MVAVAVVGGVGVDVNVIDVFAAVDGAGGDGDVVDIVGGGWCCCWWC